MATTTPAPSRGQLASLRKMLRGELVEPHDPGYDRYRAVQNSMIDRRPRAIARCADVADVAGAVGFAREHGLLLSVRGGGHDVNGFAVNDGGIVIDLSLLRGVHVDPDRRTARVGGGAVWGDLDRAAHELQMATTGASAPTVGVGGVILGGGLGYLSRRHGLSCDNLLSAEVVTADGNCLTTSRERYPDLFWALRGGGGNFGVVTSFELQLHPVGTVLGGPIFYSTHTARAALARFRDVMTGAPDDLGALFMFRRAWPLPFLPAAWRGRPVCVIMICYAGDHHAGWELIRPLLDVGPPIGHRLRPIAYPALQVGFDEVTPPGMRRCWRGELVRELDDEVIEIHATYGPKIPAASTVHISSLDGAVGRLAPGDTAFSYRDGGYATLVAAVYVDPRETAANVAWADEYWAALRTHSAGGSYVSFMMEEGHERVVAAYRDNYPRLVAVKDVYDPYNLFRMNHNIRPTT